MAFETTRWSLILTARETEMDGRAALESLCRAYRAPVFAYLRHRVGNFDDAQDLTQAFFAHFLEHRLQDVADPARGRFRSFLLVCVSNFLAAHLANVGALKRGGQATFVDAAVIEQLPGSESPDQAFDREFALTVIERAMARLAEQARRAGREHLHEALQPFLTEDPARDEYQQVADRLNMRPNTLAVAIYRLRRRLSEKVRAELVDLAASPELAAAELRHLRAVLGGL